MEYWDYTNRTFTDAHDECGIKSKSEVCLPSFISHQFRISCNVLALHCYAGNHYVTIHWVL
jgi:hypothetical protein